MRNGYNSVLVSWTTPSTGITPAGYEVFHQTKGDATRLSVGNTTSTMMTVNGLGVTYYIFVVSFGAEGAPVLPSAHSNAPAFTIRKIYCNMVIFTCLPQFSYLSDLFFVCHVISPCSYPATTTEWYTNTYS